MLRSGAAPEYAASRSRFAEYRIEQKGDDDQAHGDHEPDRHHQAGVANPKGPEAL